MRFRKTSAGLTVQATCGSYVVMLGMDMPESECAGLLGFAIHRTDPAQQEAIWMEGMKCFEASDPGFPPGARYRTREHPIQGFTWSDFTAKPGRTYTYRVLAMYGTPEALQPKKTVELTVRTEDFSEGAHGVFFNRGAAASQEYVRRFGNRSMAGATADDPRWAWLSRGAAEAIENFVGRAAGAGWGLRVAAYEFRSKRVANALREAIDRGVAVEILYDANANKPNEKTGEVFPRDQNRATAKSAGLDAVCTERITRSDVKAPPIAHSKIIVLLKDGKPQAVLTGSTNFSDGGMFGQSNVVHVVNDEVIAGAYLQYVELLSSNPAHNDLQETLTASIALPATSPRVGTSVVFSPRQDTDALDWYAGLAAGADQSLFMTFAFGMNAIFQNAYMHGNAPLRYALLDKQLGPGVKKDKKEAETQKMIDLARMKENRIAIGNRLNLTAFDGWLKETLTGLNEHVRFIHTKYMLINPLGDDPIVITGSANFSAASSNDNDENMLVIRGDQRVADIYLGEYMRLWNHYAFRQWADSAAAKDKRPKFLRPDDSWTQRYFQDTDQGRQRALFVSSPASTLSKDG